MSIIYVLIPIAILFVIIAIAVFFWAVKTDQFSDLDKQAHSILFDEPGNNKASSKDKTKQINNKP